jgi:hypothetical protein
MSEEYRTYDICTPGTGFPPGDIDPDLSLDLGDIGPDLPFGLDYRLSREVPAVVFLDGPGWRTIAADIDSFLRAMRL